MSVPAVLIDALESEEFYGLMQAYRHAPLTPQKDVVEAFEAVKAYIWRAATGDTK